VRIFEDTKGVIRSCKSKPDWHQPKELGRKDKILWTTHYTENITLSYTN